MLRSDPARRFGALAMDASRHVEAALAHAERRGAPGPCLVLERVPAAQELDQLLVNPRIGGIGFASSVEGALRRDQLADPRVAHEFQQGRWALPAKGPSAVYFLGSIHRFTREMAKDAVRAGVTDLHVRAGPFWVPVPLMRMVEAVRQLRQVRSAAFALRDRTIERLARIGAREHVERLVPGGLLTSEEAFAQMIEGAAARTDYIPGRVILVCGNLAPGGAERQVANTLIGLKQRGLDDVSLLAHYLHPGPDALDFHLPRVRAAEVPAREIQRDIQSLDDPRLPEVLRGVESALPSGLVLDIANLVLEFEAAKPEIVHAWLDWDNVRAGIAAAIAGVPAVLVSGRNLAPYHYKLHASYMLGAYRALASLPQVAFLNNSRAGGDDYADWIGISRKRVQVIRNGFDYVGCRLSDAERDEGRRALGIERDAFVVGGVFRFDEEKRPLLWLDVAERILRQIPDARFLLFGKGSMRPAVEERIAKLGLGGRVILAGVTAEPLRAMSLMDVFLLTSHGEGLPNVLIEAQSVGVPVVCTRVGGAPEALQEGVSGWAVDADNPDKLAAAIVRLSRDPEARKRALREGPDFVQRTFGVERMISETLDAYWPRRAKRPRPTLRGASNGAPPA